MDSLKRTDSAPFSRRQFVIASATFGLGLAAIALPDLARADEDSLGYLDDEATVGDAMRLTNPELYYSLSDIEKVVVDSTPFGIDNEKTGFAEEQDGAARSSNVYGYGSLSTRHYENTIEFVARFNTTAVCPVTSIYLNITNCSTGRVVFGHVETGQNQKYLTYSGSKGGLAKGVKHRITAVGTIVTPPAGDWLIALPPAQATNYETL